jgi:hypothetical protein
MRYDNALNAEHRNSEATCWDYPEQHMILIPGFAASKT